MRLAPTRTDKVPNTSATAASSGADLNGGAIRNACEQIRERLAEVASRMLNIHPNDVRFVDGVVTGIGFHDRHIGWAELTNAAYHQRVSLWAAGFYRTEGLHWDAERMQGEPFKYFAYGASVSEVEVDGFTGAYRTRRVDIVHDVGDSLSPLVDLGQIEGGFVQGAGWLTLEELRWDTTDGPHRGRLSTQSASTYKLPSFSEMPEDFRVHLFERATESGVVYGSKAVGEPPLMLAFSVREALRQAAARLRPGGPRDRPGEPRDARGGVLGGRGGTFWARGTSARRVGGLGGVRRGDALGCGRHGARHHRARPPIPRPGLRGADVDWLGAVQHLRREGEPGVLVTVTAVRGHAPRDPGAKMVVSAGRTWGSVGGGNLEQTAVERARTLLREHAMAPETQEMRLNEHARTEHGRQCCGGEVTLLLEPLPVRPTVAVFGVGHVGYELALVLSRLELSLHLVDSRAAELDPLRLADVTEGIADVTVHQALLGETVLERLPRRGARPGHDPRPRRGLRAVRRRAAADRCRRGPVRQHRADRLER